MSTRITIITSEMPDECSVGVFFSVMDPMRFEHHAYNHRQTINAKFIVDELEATNSIGLIVGTHWKELIDLVAESKGYHIVLKPSSEIGYMSNAIIRIKNTIDSHYPGTWNPSYDLWVEHFEDVISLLDARSRNQTTEPPEVQLLMTGLINSGDRNHSLHDKLRQLFSRSKGFGVKEIIEKGRTIIQSQYLIAHERAKNNSKVMTMPDGSKVLVTEAPELINITHNELYDKYKSENLENISGTLVMNIRFGEKDRIGLSFRSRDDKVDAKSLMKGLGDGNKFGAGGSFERV